MKLLWIDDNAKRENERATDVSSLLNYDLEFFKYDPSNFDTCLDNIKRRLNGIRLIIIDHFLSNKAPNTQKESIIHRGGFIGELLREINPHIPIIGVTGAVNLKKITNSNSKLNYDELFSIDKIASDENIEAILSISDGYYLIKKRKVNSIDKILKLLNPPKYEIDRLKAAFPKELKDEVSLRELNLSFNLATYIRKVLLRQPGFLLDKYWAATRLGVKFESFHIVQKYLNNALYDGVFKDNLRELWWSIKIPDLIFQKFENIREIWDIRSKIKSIRQKNYSECFVCQGRNSSAPPEIVGFTDSVSKLPRQMHIRCSKPHPHFEARNYFEDIRIMNDE